MGPSGHPHLYAILQVTQRGPATVSVRQPAAALRHGRRHRHGPASEKEVAALSAVRSRSLVMNTRPFGAMINACRRRARPCPPTPPRPCWASLPCRWACSAASSSALGAAALHNQLLQDSSCRRCSAFFGGTRFVPIISAPWSTWSSASPCIYVWPVVQSGINGARRLSGPRVRLWQAPGSTACWSAPSSPSVCTMCSICPSGRPLLGGTAIVGGVARAPARRTSSSPSWPLRTVHYRVLGRAPPASWPVSSRLMIFGSARRGARACISCAKPENRKVGRRPAALRGADLHAHRYHRAARVHLPLRRAAHVRGALRAGGRCPT